MAVFPLSSPSQDPLGRALRAVHLAALLPVGGFVALMMVQWLPAATVLPFAWTAAALANIAVAAGMALRLRHASAPIPAPLSWTYAIAVLLGGYFVHAFSHDLYFGRFQPVSFTRVFGPPLVLLFYGVVTLLLPNFARLHRFRRTPLLLDAALLVLTTSLLLCTLQAWRFHRFEGFRWRFLKDPGYWRQLFQAATSTDYWTIVFPTLSLVAALLLFPVRRSPRAYTVTAAVLACLWPIAYLVFARPW